MRLNHLFWGVFLIVLGGLFLLNNYIGFSFDFDSIFNFWPIVLILIGFKILVKNNLFKSVIIIISAIFVAIIVYSLIFHNVTCSHMRFYKDSTKEKRETISQNFISSIKRSYLTIDYDFGDFKLNTDTQKLIDGEVIFTRGKYYFDGDISDSVADYKLISNNNEKMKFWQSKKFNYLKLSIHPLPEWNLNFSNNFVDAKLNLTQINLRTLNFESNFSKGSILLNPSGEDCKIDLEFNFSNYKINIPDSITVEVTLNENLSSVHLNGFTKVEKNHYVSKYPNNTKSKILINLSSNFSKVVITQ